MISVYNYASSIVIDPEGNIYVTGNTYSGRLLATDYDDAFVSKIEANHGQANVPYAHSKSDYRRKPERISLGCFNLCEQRGHWDDKQPQQRSVCSGIIPTCMWA